MKLGLRRTVMWSATWAGVLSIGAAACAADPGDDLKTSTSGVTTPSGSGGGTGTSGGGGSSGTSTSSSSGSTSGSSSSGTAPPPTDDASDDTTSSGDDAAAPASDAGPPMVVTCTTCPVSLEYETNAPATGQTNNNVYYVLKNQGSAGIALSGLTIRYWFSATAASWVYDYDYAGNSDGSAIAKAQVVATFKPAPNPTAKATQYLELSFPSVTSSIAPMGMATISGRLHDSSYAPINPSNDYSYDGADTAYTASMTSTVYQNGTLIWGVEPGGSGAPTTSTDAGDP
jgi:endoglucanase